MTRISSAEKLLLADRFAAYIASRGKSALARVAADREMKI